MTDPSAIPTPTEILGGGFATGAAASVHGVGIEEFERAKIKSSKSLKKLC